jgi:hypothetical protein
MTLAQGRCEQRRLVSRRAKARLALGETAVADSRPLGCPRLAGPGRTGLAAVEARYLLAAGMTLAHSSDIEDPRRHPESRTSGMSVRHFSRGISGGRHKPGPLWSHHVGLISNTSSITIKRDFRPASQE